jgi:hypothetical protein
MRIVFALHHAGAFRSFEEVVRYWCHAGHSVHMLVGDLQKPTEVDRGLKACLAELDGFTVEGMHYRQKWLKLTADYALAAQARVPAIASPDRVPDPA